MLNDKRGDYLSETDRQHRKYRAQLAVIAACGCVWVALIGIGCLAAVGAILGGIAWAAVETFRFLSGGS